MAALSRGIPSGTLRDSRLTDTDACYRRTTGSADKLFRFRTAQSFTTTLVPTFTRS